MSRQTHSVAQLPGLNLLRPRLPHQIPLAAAAQEPARDKMALFADKRLGKCTIATEWVLSRPSQPTSVLIVAPPSSLPDWVRNLEADGQRAVLLQGTEKQRFELIEEHGRQSDGTPTFFIINPQGLFHPAGKGAQKCPECELEGFPVFGCSTCGGSGKIKSRNKPEPTAVAMAPWDAVIWDESIELKNPKSQVNYIAKACFKYTKCKAILTGEPTPEGIFDIFEQMIWCFGNFMGHKNFWDWRHDLFIQDGFRWIPRLGSLRKINEAIEARSLFLTRRAAGVEENKKRTIMYCDLPQKLRDIYDHCERHYQLPSDIPRPKTRTKFVIVMRNWLASLAGGCREGYLSDHKINALMHLILKKYKDEQFMVLFRFNWELDRVASILQEHGIMYAELRGGMTTDERAQVADRLRSKKLRGVLCQIKAVKYGADLSMINHLYRFSLPHSYNEISQSQDRVVHTLKKDLIRIIDLVTRDTVDEDIQEAITGKTKYARDFMETCTAAMSRRRKR